VYTEWQTGTFLVFILIFFGVAQGNKIQCIEKEDFFYCGVIITVYHTYNVYIHV
jgi:hypothetical protein